MKIIDRITIEELNQMVQKMFGNLVKADVDIEKELLIVDMDLHADGEAKLLESGSEQKNLWGINLHPGNYGTEEFIEYDSMINIKPNQKNFSRNVEDEEVREKIKKIVEDKVSE